MHLDFSTILSNIFSLIPWWVIPIILLAAYLKIKIEKWEKNNRKNKKKKNKYNNEPQSKYENNRPINKVNSDRGSLYTTINNQPKPEAIVDTKQKGDEYEAYVCKHFEEQGYKIAPHGKDNGVKDQGIDIILKKDKEILFIQCKNWNVKHKYKIDHKEIQYIRMNVRDYIEKNQLFTMYNWKILYVTSENILENSAHYKIREHREEIEHQIIEM